MNEPKSLHGLMAAFKDHEELLAAVRHARSEGYRRMDAYTPFPVEGLADALDFRGWPVPLLFLLGGICGCVGGYFLQWYAMAGDIPLNIGGKPLNSWPMFIPVTFELTVLTSALFGFFGTLALNRSPELYHPVFNVPDFRAHASRDRFFLCIEAVDPRFDRIRTRAFLESTAAYRVEEVTP